MNAKDRGRALAFGSLCFTVVLYGAALWIDTGANPFRKTETFSPTNLEAVIFLSAAIFLSICPLIAEDVPAK